MPDKVLETPYPVIDIDPHFSRVVRYFRPSDYGVWATATVAVPSALVLWEMVDPRKIVVKQMEAGPRTTLPSGRVAMGDAISIVTRRMVTGVKVASVIGFCGGFLLAYQNSSKRFWGWTENKREEEMDLAELTQRAKEGKPLYGESSQPEWVLGAAYRNSVFSQLKFSAFPMFNLVNHPHHGTDPAKYGVKAEATTEES
ncbi:nadh-ubiquinone oxidoreductase 21 kda subunit [Moniliophthora roreri MCA 2997]|uniref:Nadh-ubiquinone oxidoreductase 21 kDa subunit n=2 Tax=Moniliophthora roreri TaxID=221103 RepID=V2XZ05_MONRO|nr:nadh-ubiquinone oxidoreductase 21 kda subunit [Moniliophthora roreri MCA 2997]KAI3600478.1 nadh-ubiquinone oxidoreductase 21 kda subunit [Moniliophthora roreri]